MTTTTQLLFSPDASPADILAGVQGFLTSKNPFTLLGVDIFLRDGRTNGQTTLVIDYLTNGASDYDAALFQASSRDLLDVDIDAALGVPGPTLPVFILDITSVYRRRINLPSVLVISAGIYQQGTDPLNPQPMIVAANGAIAAGAQGTAAIVAPGGGVISGTSRNVLNQRTYAWAAGMPGIVVVDPRHTPIEEQVGGPGCCP